MNRSEIPERPKGTRTTLWGRFCLLTVVVCGTLVTGCQSMHSEKSVTAARAANDEFYAALNAILTGDMKPMDQIWSHSDDVTYLPPTGEILAGWKAVRTNWQAQADAKLGGSVTPRDVRIVIPCPTVAVVTTRETGTSPNVPGGPMKVDIRATNVYREEAGNWKMIHHHTDRMPKLEAAENAGGR